MLLNCCDREDSWESYRLQGDQTIHPKGNQPWIFTGRTDAEAPILWPPDAKRRLIGKDGDAGKDWGQEKMAEEGILDTITNSMDMNLSKLWDSEGQRRLACCSSWGCRELDMT